MWKESYGTGIEIIDKQHKELFHMVEKLVKSVEGDGQWDGKRKSCREAVSFLKNYVDLHFKAEEGYQASIQYEGLEKHKELHRKFTRGVLEYEKKLAETDFDQGVVKGFVGMLTSWLINHVAGEDQKYVHKELPRESSKEKTLMQCFIRSVSQILERMASINPKELSGMNLEKEKEVGALFITVGVTGEIEGKIIYGFSKEFALSMLKIMTMMEMKEIDEMVCSAMAEISNIISGNATVALSDKGYQCDITTPQATQEIRETETEGIKGKILIRSKLGELSLGTTFLV